MNMMNLQNFKHVQVRSKDTSTGLKSNKVYAVNCDSCGRFKGYFCRGYKNHTCNSCAQRGVTHEVSAETRARHPNVDFDDRVTRVDSQGANFSMFRCRCLKCGGDRGYRRKNQLDKICKACSNRKMSPEQKRLYLRMQGALRLSLKKRSITKTGSTFSLLGYSLDDLRKSLESRFLPGMSWENMSEWHIDHKRPNSWFSYRSADDPEFKKCWGLDNLQPLWAADNLKKNNRWES